MPLSLSLFCVFFVAHAQGPGFYWDTPVEVSDDLLERETVVVDEVWSRRLESHYHAVMVISDETIARLQADFQKMGGTAENDLGSRAFARTFAEKLRARLNTIASARGVEVPLTTARLVEELVEGGAESFASALSRGHPGLREPNARALRALLIQSLFSTALTHTRLKTQFREVLADPEHRGALGGRMDAKLGLPASDGIAPPGVTFLGGGAGGPGTGGPGGGSAGPGLQPGLPVPPPEAAALFGSVPTIAPGFAVPILGQAATMFPTQAAAMQPPPIAPGDPSAVQAGAAAVSRLLPPGALGLGEAAPSSLAGGVATAMAPAGLGHVGLPGGIGMIPPQPSAGPPPTLRGGSGMIPAQPTPGPPVTQPAGVTPPPAAALGVAADAGGANITLGQLREGMAQIREALADRRRRGREEEEEDAEHERSVIALRDSLNQALADAGFPMQPATTPAPPGGQPAGAIELTAGEAIRRFFVDSDLGQWFLAVTGSFLSVMLSAAFSTVSLYFSLGVAPVGAGVAATLIAFYSWSLQTGMRVLQWGTGTAVVAATSGAALGSEILLTTGVLMGCILLAHAILAGTLVREARRATTPPDTPRTEALRKQLGSMERLLADVTSSVAEQAAARLAASGGGQGHAEGRWDADGRWVPAAGSPGGRGEVRFAGTAGDVAGGAMGTLRAYAGAAPPDGAMTHTGHRLGVGSQGTPQPPAPGPGHQSPPGTAPPPPQQYYAPPPGPGFAPADPSPPAGSPVGPGGGASPGYGSSSGSVYGPGADPYVTGRRTGVLSLRRERMGEEVYWNARDGRSSITQTVIDTATSGPGALHPDSEEYKALYKTARLIDMECEAAYLQGGYHTFENALRTSPSLEVNLSTVAAWSYRKVHKDSAAARALEAILPPGQADLAPQWAVEMAQDESKALHKEAERVGAQRPPGPTSTSGPAATTTTTTTTSRRRRGKGAGGKGS